MRRLLLLSLLAAAAVPAPSEAAIPCRDKIYNDWYADGKIASTYSHACYVDALKHIPADAQVYSSLGADITAAMRASERRSEGKVVPKEIGQGFKPQNVLAVTRTRSPVQSKLPVMSHDPSLGEQSTIASGPVSSSSSSAPVPILVLGALALALVAAGAIGAGVRHSRSRRR